MSASSRTKNGFINAEKPDSQDICFVPDGDHAAFMEHYTGKQYPVGNIIDTGGTILGKHRGIIRYTIGQRRGLGLSLPEPLYVKAINSEDNTVILCKEEELYGTDAVVEDMNWVSIEAPTKKLRCKVKIRYRQSEKWATVTPLDGNTVKIVFDEPQRAITAGQAAVLYDGDTVLGGGTIK